MGLVGPPVWFKRECLPTEISSRVDRRVRSSPVSTTPMMKAPAPEGGGQLPGPEEPLSDGSREQADSVKSEDSGEAHRSSAGSDQDSSPRKQGRASAIAATIGIAVVFAGSGYLLGKSTGEDLGAARTAGKEAGQRAGVKKGTSAGYSAGFRRGRAQGYQSTFGPAYKREYAQAYEDAGLESPAIKEIKVPKQ